MFGLNVSWIFDMVPRQLRESGAEGVDALGFHLEMAFLGHGSVPAMVCQVKCSHASEKKYSHIICGAKDSEKQDICWC